MNQNYLGSFLHKENPEPDKEVTMEELQECYESLAQIVKKHGKEYLPLFERVHNEIQMRKKENRLIDIAHRVAENSEK